MYVDFSSREDRLSYLLHPYNLLPLGNNLRSVFKNPVAMCIKAVEL